MDIKPVDKVTVMGRKMVVEHQCTDVTIIVFAKGENLPYNRGSYPSQSYWRVQISIPNCGTSWH